MNTVRTPRTLVGHAGKAVTALTVGAVVLASVTCAQAGTATAAVPAAAPSLVTPYGSSPLVSDHFARSVTSGWASADLGGAYTMSGSPAAHSVSSGQANLSNIPAGNTVEETLASAVSRDVEAHLTFTVPTITGASFGVYQGIEMRRQADDGAYVVRVRIRAGGVATLSVIRNGPTGSYSVLSAALPVLTSGQTLNVQANVLGTAPVTVQARAWVEGAAQPDWTAATDTTATAITATGSVGTWSYVSGASTATSIAVSSLEAWDINTSQTSSPVLGTPPAGMNYPKATLANTGADAMTAATGRARTAFYGNLVLSASNPAAHDLDVYGQVLVTASSTPWTATLSNVYVHGSRLPALSAPYTKNYESSLGLIQNTGASNASIHLDGVTLVPDYPDTRWDGLLGHDFSSDNWGLLIAHVTDGVGIQNVTAGTNPPINITLNRVFIDWLAFWAFSPGSPNNPQTTHNDDIQGFGGTNIRIGQGSWLGGFQSMPTGFTRPNGLVHNDPFGYVGQGASYVPPGGNTAQGSNNANIQMNTTEGTWTGLVLTDVYLDGANFGINGATNIKFSNSSITRVRYGKSQYKWPTQYSSYNTVPNGLSWTSGTNLHDDGSALTIR